MQEEVEQKVVTLIVDCGKLTEQELRKALAKLMEQMKAQKQGKQPKHGKMTVKQLAAQDKGMQSIEVTDKNIGSFNRIARKYGIDFAPFKVKGENRYMVFFKAADTDAMTAAFKEYTNKEKPADSTHSLTRGLKPYEQLERQAEFHSSEKT